MVQTIIFDLGKVLVPFDLKRGYAALRPHCRYDPDEIPKRIGGTDLVLRFEAGKISPGEFVRELSALLDLKVDYGQFCDLWSSIFLPEPLIPDAFIAGLKHHYRLLLLSNTNAIHFEMIRRTYPLLRHFDACILSYEVGAMKPEPAIYRAAIQQAGCQPHECFYIDDVLSYVEAGRREGLDAVQFISFDQLRADMQARDIKFS